MIILFLLLILPGTALASPSVPSYGAELLKGISALIFIVAFFIVSVYFLKKLKIPSRFKSGNIRLIERLYIDNKHYIAIIEVHGRKFIIGVGDSVTLLSEMKEGKDEKDH